MGRLRAWNRGRAAVTLVLLGVGLGVALPAFAGSFSAVPVQLSLPANARAASFTITNNDAAPVSIRVKALAWSQVDGKDRYEPTANAIVSPQIFTIKSGRKQLVRIGVRDRQAAKAYRLFVEEIPLQKPEAGQIQVVLRLNLPLYLLPKNGEKSDLKWLALRDSDGSMVLEARNQGTIHEQINEIDIEQGGHSQTVTKEMGVVLPGSARRWKVDSAVKLQPGVPAMVKAHGPNSDSQTQIIVEPN